MITALLFPALLFAQTNISGVVNTYHKILGINYLVSGLKLDNVSGIAVNDRVMIIQMKGATVNTSNTSSFGSVTNLNNAGNYELATVCAVRNDSVFLLQQLLNNYTVTDKIQLVRIPTYMSALVTDSLEAAPWDSAAGKGGVLAIIVTGTLSLNAPISATGKGFKGGVYYKDAGGCGNNAFTNYYYNPSPSSYLIYNNVQFGAYKGESVSDLPLSFSGGKGACANGGGGGNNHNNGGGGGSNLAAGGKGGDNISTVGCTGQHAAIGGYALNNNTGTKLFLGGGGGAGHANNTATSSGGGFGGGIIFIQAQTLTSNGYTITANGTAGGNVNGDGASGGGGGGSIIASISNYSDLVNCETKGGHGGTVNDELISGRCYGEGGGGSGGVIYVSGSQPSGTFAVAGGSKGLKINSTCATSTGVNGNTGSIVTNYQYRESNTLSTCAYTLPVNWIDFKIMLLAYDKPLMQWMVSGATNKTVFKVERRKIDKSWFLVEEIKGSENLINYEFTETLPPGQYQYRIGLTENQRITYSPVRSIQIRSNQTLFYSPAIQSVLINYDITPNDHLRIYDISGKPVFEKKFVTPLSSFSQNVSFLKNGTYIVQMGFATVKFTKHTQ